MKIDMPDIHGLTTSGFAFAINPKNLASGLQRISEQIDAAQVLVQECEISVLTKQDDFQLVELRMVLAAKVDGQ